MEGGLKRLGALFLKAWAVALIPLGVGVMLYGFFRKLAHNQWEDPLSMGVATVVLGAILWVLAKKLDAAAQLVRYRRRQNRVIRLARKCGGRLTATETAAEAGLTVEEAEEILKGLSEGGYVELEVAEAGLVVYSFPEVLFAHEKYGGRRVDEG